jgi:alpha-L-fucosidase 2
MIPQPHILIVSLLLACTVQAQQQPLQLWYKQPAQKWTDALPIGNGRLGAMIYGGVQQDHLQFNEETLWTGRPRAFEHPGAVDYLPQIRELLFAGKQAEAEALAGKHFMGMKDPDDSAYVRLKDTWLQQVLKDTLPAATSFDDSKLPVMRVPTPDGWERLNLDGLDGTVWLRTTFMVPENWLGKNLVLDLGRIRDMDVTFINGVRIGSTDGMSNRRRYVVDGSLLKKGKNSIAIQVINFFDKGGLSGVKGAQRSLLVYPEGSRGDTLALDGDWKYVIRNTDPPATPRYEADYQPFGDLWLQFNQTGSVSNYRRDLDIANALASVSYTSGGVQYKRTYFVSVPAQCMVVHLGASQPGRISLNAFFKTLHRRHATRKIDDRTLAISLAVTNGALRGESFLRVHTTGGKVTVSDTGIAIQGANEAVLYLVAATNFVNYKDVSADPELRCKSMLQNVSGRSYADMKAMHIGTYTRGFNTFSIQLPAGKNAALPTDERIRRFKPQDDAALMALYIQYARYLLLSSSRAGTQPANLQGIWNDLLTPPWGSKYTSNINLEMNYWPAELLNLSSCAEPLFRMIRELAEAGRRTAMAHYGAPGWVLHHNTDLWRGTAPINAANHGIWVTGAAWLCQHIWEHYLFTHDTLFLQQYYPYMKGAAAFFVHFLVKDPRTGLLISTPSNSPEQGGLVAGPTMDHQIIRELFANCIEAAAILKRDGNFSDTLKAKRAQIAPNEIGKHGQLKEWLEDVDDTSNRHRHVSHLWGVFPGTDITWKDTAMMKAARQSLLYRGDGGTGWSLAWKVNLWARFKDGDHALRMVQALLEPAIDATGRESGGVYNNLFDAHPPFQIDGNFGGAAGMAEMLVQSHTGEIELLPALPAVIPHGAVKGICARGGFVLNMTWKAGKLQTVEVISNAGNRCRLKYGDKQAVIETQRGSRYVLNGDLKQ